HRRARDRDRHVGIRRRLILSTQVVPHASEFRLDARAVFSIASTVACRLPRSGSVSIFMFCAMRGRLPLWVHSTEKGACPGSPELSTQTSVFVPFRRVSYDQSAGFHLMTVA